MTQTITHSFYVYTCTTCNGVHAILESFRAECERVGNSQAWYCPYCRARYAYGESEANRLKKQIAAEKAEKERAIRSRDLALQREMDALAEAKHFRQSRDGIKGALVKQKKRICNGVCPCCNRTFANLQRHMNSQHPKFGATES